MVTTAQSTARTPRSASTTKPPVLRKSQPMQVWTDRAPMTRLKSQKKIATMNWAVSTLSPTALRTSKLTYHTDGFSPLKKWTVLTIVFLVQVSMNFNTSLYSNAIKGIGEEFNVSAQAARLGAAIFLITYAFGCELWAPWSEEFGRRPVLQASMFLVNIWQLPVALPPNFGTILVGRALGGLSTAGGSVTLGMVADVSAYSHVKKAHSDTLSFRTNSPSMRTIFH